MCYACKSLVTEVVYSFVNMATLVLATQNASKLIMIINKKCGLQGVQVLEGPNHRSGGFRRDQAGSPVWATD